MFYSPTKEFVRFSTYRTSEIKALRDRIQKEKVTEEQIQLTQLRLQRLRQEYQEISNSQNQELKEVFHNSERSIADLLNQKELSRQEEDQTRTHLREAEKRRAEEQLNRSRLEEALRSETVLRDKLLARKQETQQTILELQQQWQRVSKESVGVEALSQEVRTATEELKQKQKAWEASRESNASEQRLLQQSVREETLALSDLRLKAETVQREVERQKAQQHKCELAAELCRQKLSAWSAARTVAAEDDWMVSEQRELWTMLSAMLKDCSDECKRVVEEQKSCHLRTKQALVTVEREEERKARLQERVAVLRSNLHLLHQKNDALKTKMNSIFRNDSELVRIICNKKPYPQVKGDSEAHKTTEPKEKTGEQRIKGQISKENISVLVGKSEKADLQVPRLFAEINRLV